jgi:hypothetical protein
VLPDEAGHLRAVANDQEILDRCELLYQATGRSVTLITGDSGMRISAQARGIDVVKLPETDLLQGTGTNCAPLRLPVQPEQNAGQPRNWLGCRPHQPEIKQDPSFGTAAPIPPMLDPVVHERVIWVRSAR